MRNKMIYIALSFVLWSVTLYGEENSRINTIRGTGQNVPNGYVPPLVSNGSLSMLIDYKGGQTQQQYVGMIPVIYWAGRRYGPPNDKLVPFGHFEEEYTINGQIVAQPNFWEQTLDTKQAKVICRNIYNDLFTVETIVFTHLSHNLIVVKKRFSVKSSGVTSLKLSFKYHFTPPGNDNLSPKRVKSECSWNDKSQSVEYKYELDGYKQNRGIISIFSDKSCSPVIDGQTTSLDSEIKLDKKHPGEITYYILFSDSMDGNDYLERQAKLLSCVRESGYEKILATHEAEWRKYWDESYVDLPDKPMEKVYNTAQYHLRSNATKWSFPVGIFDTHWSGRYFGWDEMFCFQALASSNHLDISKRCPEFRYSILPLAIRRIAYYGNPGIYGARFPWEALEDGVEGTPPGFWLDHVFHMSNIALSAWLQYLYTNDSTYLKTVGYPVIKECARFYVSNMVYEDSNGSMFIGKCTDLERLGPAKQNPFMTACGAIYTLEAATKASEILSENKEEAEKWRRIAIKLRESLPTKDGKYIPFKGCTEKSIASLGGLFPYPVFDSGSILQRNAVYDFVKEGKASGNMYPVGNSLCAWYAGWMASALDLLGDRNEPEKLLKEAANGAGCFSELFEINEPNVRMHPWFSTASGNYIYALNQMLLQSKDDRILIAPGVPDSWKNFSFKLACYGGLVAKVCVKKGNITKLELVSGTPEKGKNKILVVPEQMINEKKLNRKIVYSIEKENGYYQLHLYLNEQSSVIL